TPSYLGMKIEGKEMKLIALSFLVHPLLILVFSALAFIVPGASDALTNPQFHGVSQVLYEFTSSSANNGSGFEGLGDNTVFWNISTGIVMLLARYIPIVLQILIVSSLVNKKTYQQHTQDVPINNLFFSSVLIIFIILLSGLTFLPDLMLGPIGEQLLLHA
ncbi:potassium-transporting ATPase A chain 2, partial [Staphylococcus aureus F87602]